MLSVVLPLRNLRDSALHCLNSLLAVFRHLNMENDVEFVLIDDASDESSGIVDLMRQFRGSTSAATTLLRLRTRQMYVYATSMGLSLARGDVILLLAHDMIVPPAFLTKLLELSAGNDSIGILRGSSSHIDCLPQHVIVPPLPFRTYDDLCKFSQYVAGYYGPLVEEDRFLMSDAVLIKRSVIDKVGVMDKRYRHLFGDLDWGLRVQRAGFKLACAKGAWLYHDGNAHTKSLLARGVTTQTIQTIERELLTENYGKFRAKWNATLPADYPGLDGINFEELRTQAKTFDEYVAPLRLDAAICQAI